MGLMLIIALGLLFASSRVNRTHKRNIDELKKLQATVNVGHWSWDIKTKATYWSDQLFTIYAMPNSNPVTYPLWSSRVYPDDLNKVNEAKQRAITTKKPQSEEFKIIQSDGSIRYISSTIEVELDSNEDVIRIFGTNQDISDRKKAEELKLSQEIYAHSAHHDFLTRVNNRLGFDANLEHAIQSATRNKHKTALLYIDLDEFKPINDDLGHYFGDELLKVIAQRLKDSVRSEDTVARVGGDEFAIILTKITENNNAQVIAEKIIHCINKPITINGHTLTLTVSIGICIFPDDADDDEEIVRNADNAMYQTKRNGRNGYHVFTNN